MIYNTYVQLLGMMDINGPIIDNIERGGKRCINLLFLGDNVRHVSRRRLDR